MLLNLQACHFGQAWLSRGLVQEIVDFCSSFKPCHVMGRSLITKLITGGGGGYKGKH